ncbi:MAG: hypothetical protein U0414_44505 [Polyangiaceae bacterium]
METLGERIQRSGKLDASDIAELSARVASWLEHRHREGDVHGSLNPSAIVFPTGDVRAAALFHPSDVSDVPAYFSPERLEKDQTSKADDVWALGCLLYFGLTGHAPFAGSNKKDVRARLEQGAAAPLAVFDVCDDDLADIAESMIAVPLRIRVTSAAKIRDQLADWLARKRVKVGPMLDVLHQGPTVRVSLGDMVEKPAAFVDRLPSTRDLLARARVSTKSSIPPPLPAHALVESRPKSLPPPLPQSVRPPPMPLLPIDPPVLPPTPPPPVIEVPPASSRPLPNLFDDLGDPPPEAAPSPVAKPSQAPPPLVAALAPPKKPFPVWALVGVVAALVVGGYVVVRFALPSSASTPVASGEAGPPSAEPPAQRTAPVASSAQAVAPSATAAPSGPLPVRVADTEQCIESLLAPGALAEGAKPNFTFICDETDPRKVASNIRATVIRSARGGVSDAMREWAVMGWYEYAAFASMRGRCCPGAAKIVLPSQGGVCPAMDDALNKIGETSRPGVSEEEQDAAMKGFRESLLCISRSGVHGVYGPYDPPSGGQDTAFLKTFRRTRN